MKNISDIHDCFGCGVCAVVCTHKVIGIKINHKGFYEPYIINPDKCTNCGLCREVCAYSHETLSVKNRIQGSYAAWSNNAEVRKNSTSGGVAYELSRYLLSKGYKVCAVRYNVASGRAEHYIATTLDELKDSTGSKYLQSYTYDGFSAIDRKGKYLVIGTPCQIDSFRRYIQTFGCADNFILVDFFCHGVPSMIVWEKYQKWAEHKIGKIQSVKWRDKQFGWRNSYTMRITGKTGELISSRNKGDMFLNLFLSDCCLGPQCHETCRYKYDQSSADIRIGDFWGKAYKTNNEGVNSILSFSQKGQEVIRAINCTTIEHPLEIVTDGQMKTNATISPYASEVWKSLLDSTRTIKHAAKYPLKQLRIQQWKGRINHLLQIIHVKISV